MTLQEFFLALAVFITFVALRFAVPALLTAFLCYCDRRFNHPVL